MLHLPTTNSERKPLKMKTISKDIIPQPTVAIITVTYNSEKFIEPFLQSLHPLLTDNSHHLIIVDNNSSDETLHLIEQHKTSHKLKDFITLDKEDQNLGFGKGCNKAASIAEKKGIPYLWFLNPDTIADKKSGDALLSLLKKRQDIHFSGSLLFDKQGDIQASGFHFPSITNIFVSTSRLKVIDYLFPKSTTAVPIKQHPYPAEWLTGASFMTRLEHFKALEGFDPKYFLYFEEVDLFYRAKQLGLQAWCCPSSTMFHISGASTGVTNDTPNKPYPSYWFESRQRFYTQNYGIMYFIAADICMILSTLLWKCRARVLRKFDDTPKYFLMGIVKHSYAGSQTRKWINRLRL